MNQYYAESILSLGPSSSSDGILLAFFVSNSTCTPLHMWGSGFQPGIVGWFAYGYFVGTGADFHIWGVFGIPWILLWQNSDVGNPECIIWEPWFDVVW